MRVKGLDGREYKLRLSGHVATDIGGRAASDNHKAARRLLKELFPFDPPYEEVLLPGCGTQLYVDFLLPGRRLAFEIQGRQHREYVPHFHRGRTGYAAQKRRDALKKRFCDLNGLVLVELHDDDRDNWRAAVAAAFVASGPAGEPGQVGGAGGDDPVPGDAGD